MSPLETSGLGAKKHLFNQPVLNMEITATEISEGAKKGIGIWTSDTWRCKFLTFCPISIWWTHFSNCNTKSKNFSLTTPPSMYRRGCVGGVLVNPPITQGRQTWPTNQERSTIAKWRMWRSVLPQLSLYFRFDLWLKKLMKTFLWYCFCNTKYLSGFGNEFASEALPDALPKGQVSDFTCPRDACINFHG